MWHPYVSNSYQSKASLTVILGKTSYQGKWSGYATSASVVCIPEVWVWVRCECQVGQVERLDGADVLPVAVVQVGLDEMGPRKSSVLSWQSEVGTVCRAALVSTQTHALQRHYAMVWVYSAAEP